MQSKPRFLLMDKDDLVWQKLDEEAEEWDKLIRREETYRDIGNIILKYRQGKPEMMHAVVKGGYNVIYRLEYSDGSSVILRIPIKGVVPLPDEKVRYEVATMKYVAAHTTIPVPHVYHYAMAAENSTGLGPFIIMDYIEHHQNMSRVLLDPERRVDERPVLNPAISEECLGHVYAQMANILLQLADLRFPRIGSLVEDGREPISVKGRPWIGNMGDIIVHTNAPLSTLPSQTYASTDEWYHALADMHMAQFAFQCNDAVEDEDDARDKYIARQLFRNLCIQQRLWRDSEQFDGDFRLYSEDLRPANVLLDKDMRVVGVIDWEFAYAAPAQFSFDPPWWLLLEEPEYWPGGYRAWMDTYESRLQTFLRALEAEEEKTKRAALTERANSLPRTDEEVEPPLSRRMRDSWEKQTWMLNYAARKSWAFDFIWWKFLDEKYFGSNAHQDHVARLKLLSASQQKVMERLVARKMEERTRRDIVEWSDEESAKYLAELLT
ncbi:phosphotransferase family protein [Metarhizium anisopliae]